MLLAIVDDNRTDTAALEKMLRDWFIQHSLSLTLDIFSSGEDFISVLDKKTYDIVFMDVLMDGIDGVNAARIMRKISDQSLIKTLLIFCTSSTDYRSDAFSVHAFDYIKKPIEIKALSQILKDCMATLPTSQPYISILVDKSSTPVLYSDIVSVTADLHYCVIKTSEELRCRATFSELSRTLLTDSRFFVAIRGVIVNLDHVEALHDRDFFMDDGQAVPFNARKKAACKKALVERQFYLRQMQNIRSGEE